MQAAEFDLVCLKLLQNTRRQQEVREAIVQSRIKSLHHHNPKDRDCKYARYARHSIVNTRSRANPVLIYGIHNHGGERRYCDGHTKPENNQSREELLPITSSDRRQGEQNEAQSDDERTNDQRTLCTVSGDKSARPAGEYKDKQN